MAESPETFERTESSVDLNILTPLIYPAAIVAFLLAFSRPHLGIYFLVLVLPLQTLRYQIQSYPLGASIVDIVLLGALIGTLRDRSEPLFSDLPVKGMLLIFFIYSYLSLWHGSLFMGLPWPITPDDLRFSFWKSCVELGVLTFITFAVIKTREQIRTVLMVMCVSALLIGIDFFQVVSERDLSHFSDSVRYSSLLGYAGVNGLAAFEAMFALFLVGLVSFQVGKTLRTLALITLVVCVYCLLFAFSRGAYVAFAAGVLLVAAAQKRFLIIAIVAGLLGTAMLVPSVRERVSGTYVQTSDSSEEGLESSAQERVIIWQDALQLFKAFPLAGTGFQTYEFMHRALGYGDTHNYYLKVLVEQGIIGLLIFLVIVWQMFAQGYGLFLKSTEPFLSALGLGFVGCVMGAAVANLFGDRWTYLQVDSYLWILLALVCRARVLTNQPQEQENDVQETASAFTVRSPLAAGPGTPAIAPNI